MKTDIEIAQEAVMEPITKVAESIGIEADDLELYGKYKAKLSEEFLRKIQDRPNGKLILVTAINPTPAGEGKTTTTVQIFPDHLNVVLFLRQMGQTDDGIHNAYNQYKIKSIILYIIVFLSLRMLLDQHDHENCRCKIVGLYMPHILFPVF